MLKTYTGEPIKVLGTFNADVKYENQQLNLPLLVVDGDGPSLVATFSITLNWKSIKHLSTGLDGLLQRHFQNELDTLKDVYAKLVIKPEKTCQYASVVIIRSPLTQPFTLISFRYQSRKIFLPL